MTAAGLTVGACCAVLAGAAALGVTAVTSEHHHQRHRPRAAAEGFRQPKSLIAIGSGQKTGRGRPVTQTRDGLVPEHHTDILIVVKDPAEGS